MERAGEGTEVPGGVLTERAMFWRRKTHLKNNGRTVKPFSPLTFFQYFRQVSGSYLPRAPTNSDTTNQPPPSQTTSPHSTCTTLYRPPCTALRPGHRAQQRKSGHDHAQKTP